MTTRRKQAHGMVRITQIRSRIGNQQRVVRVLTDGLGLGRIGASVELPDNPYTRGMIAKVRHMVRVEELAAPAAARKAAEEPASQADQAAAPAADDQPAAKRQRRAPARDAAASEE